ncbi:MAG: hypothetical protein HFH68_15220 [Lachnospiraceae bacterium]|nr:hypothetical protein [Lachnospiraceae bacterium]
MLLESYHIEGSPFFFHGHCHCIVVAILAQEDKSYKADILENISRLLLKIRSVLKEKNTEAYKM